MADQVFPIKFVHPNLKLLSYSSGVTLHRCPRKYELYKLLGKRAADDGSSGQEHLTFGDAVGIAIQEMLTHGDKNKATFAVFMAWKSSIDDDAGERDKKTFWHALYAIDKFDLLLKTVLAKYELIAINGRPATEVGFSLALGDGYFYRGFIDAVLRHKVTGEIVVLENKTTKFKNLHEAMYKNSGQGLGYSLVLDVLTHEFEVAETSSYKVIYCAYKSTALEFEVFNFTKSHTQRALWIKNMLHDVRLIEDFAIDNYFPGYGESCYDFFRPCEYLDLCNLSTERLIGGTIEAHPAKEDDASKYDYHFDLEQVIESQLARY